MTAPRDIVLVVDDSPATLGVLNDTLDAAGFTVLIAQSGAGALALVDRVTPDIVLMDAIMPAMDGFETCRRMKLSPGLRPVPIIFMTGLTETEHVIRGLEAGGVDYVAKPVAPAEVVARIKVHLANARLTQSAQIALDAAGRFLLAVDRDGVVRWITPQAAKLLGGGASHAADGSEAVQLSPEIRAWIGELWTAGSAQRQALLVSMPGSEGRQVELSSIGPVGPAELLLRVVETDGASGEALLKAQLSLTRREAEVLLWLCRGKSNRDIGDILGLSPRTVNKHLEQVYAKLGVENRASATALAMRVLHPN
jgi:DNA-binding response OmpR family regulator/DNA-binding CsgD family transcriptional regulator